MVDNPLQESIDKAKKTYKSIHNISLPALPRMSFCRQPTPRQVVAAVEKAGQAFTGTANDYAAKTRVTFYKVGKTTLGQYDNRNNEPVAQMLINLGNGKNPKYYVLTGRIEWNQKGDITFTRTSIRKRGPEGNKSFEDVTDITLTLSKEGHIPSAEEIKEQVKNLGEKARTAAKKLAGRQTQEQGTAVVHLDNAQGFKLAPVATPGVAGFDQGTREV
jgi:hypothetical protein